MKIRQLFEAPRKVAVAAFGRMNPPTIGHDKLVNKIKEVDGDHYLFLSQTQKPKDNPLPFDVKLEFAKKFFPSVNVGDPTVRTPIQMLQMLEKLGYTDVVYVAGSDRVEQFEKLFNDYNGKEYNFNSIQVVSAGERDPDADGAEGMSASKMRAAAASGDFDSFAQGVPTPALAQKLYDAVRVGMGIKDTVSTEAGRGYRSAAEATSLAVRMQRAAEKQRAKSNASLARTPSSIPKKEEPKKQEGSLGEFAMGGDDGEDPTDNYPCYDCGSTIFLHHTELCELAEDNAIRDLPAEPGSQHWSGRIPKGLRPIPGLAEGVAEVSRATIDRYVSKASDAHGDADFAARMSKNDPDKRSYHVDQKKTAEKRRQGISRALDRMSKTEGVAEGNTQDLSKVSTEKLQAHWNKHKDEPGAGAVFAQQLKAVARELARRKKSEATGDKPFDNMMKTIKKGTAKQATADRRDQRKQSQQQARDAFGTSPAASLGIRKPSVPEAAYEGNIGIMELFKFFSKAEKEDPKLVARVKDMIKQRRDKEVWRIIQDYTGTQLTGKEFEGSIKEAIFRESGHSKHWCEATQKWQYRKELGRTGSS